MRLIDSNIFIYARGRHAHSAACRAVIEHAAGHPEWLVSALVLLELTHFYRDAGRYAQAVRTAFAPAELLTEDLIWAAHHCRRHEEFNDHVLLAQAHRIGAEGVISVDGFFDRQRHFDVRRFAPEDSGR